MDAKKRFGWVALFSIAMGFLESAVVIYLREVMYKHGFTFPLVPLHHNLAAVELWREVATIIMLLAIGILAGKNKAEQLAYFIFSFAVWDIFYYVFLYVFLGWPQTLLTWDILFLIPVPWVGPVITPVIIATTMIIFSTTIIHFSSKYHVVSLRKKEKLLLLSGSIICILSFIEDYVRQNKTILYNNWGKGRSFLSEMAVYVPSKFDWPLFGIGEGILLLAYILYTLRISRQANAGVYSS